MTMHNIDTATSQRRLVIEHPIDTELPPSEMTQLQQSLQLNENVIRQRLHSKPPATHKIRTKEKGWVL